MLTQGVRPMNAACFLDCRLTRWRSMQLTMAGDWWWSEPAPVDATLCDLHNSDIPVLAG